MIKIFEKIRYLLVGERTITEKGKLIAKDKKLTDTEKMRKIFDIYSNYLNSEQLKFDIEYAIYELYYEEVMRNSSSYLRIEKSVRNNMYYVIGTQFIKQISNLKNIDKFSCSYDQQQFLDIINNIGNKIYTPKFDYEKFYTNREANEKISELNQNIVEMIKKYGRSFAQNQTNEPNDKKDFLAL